MQNIRCRCGKIVCQTTGVPEASRLPHSCPTESAPAVVILCRHCKSYVVIHVPGVSSLYNADTPPEDSALVYRECEQLHKTQR